MRPILTMDFETDPFEHEKRVKPFACGLFDGKDFASVWSYKCAAKMVEHLDKFHDPSIIYMHNGGRFDIFFLMPWLDSEMTIINGRIVKAQMGKHEIRDSFSIIPVPLKEYKKDDIDISKLKAECRNEHRTEILSYLRGDCVYLHELVTAFQSEFGDYLTIGSSAIKQLKSFHDFRQVTSNVDAEFRSDFFRGGRVQCFQSGIIKSPFKIGDVNSMYPKVMRDFRHPNTSNYTVRKSIGPNTHFIIAQGKNDNAFWGKDKKGHLSFVEPEGVFCTTIHEWNAAEEIGRFKCDKILLTFDTEDVICFDEFVDHFYNARLKAQANDDKILYLFYKLILNSAYGKFAQNPDNFRDNFITHGEIMEPPWTMKHIYNEGEWIIWDKKVIRHSYYNVAIGASITGAARSILLRAIDKADNLMYCDTDSIIAGSINGVELDSKKLGAWKIEGQGDTIAIAGKKMYACFNGDECIKHASKGARISPEEIVKVAQGEIIQFKKDAPTFHLNGDVTWIKRNIRRTV